MQRIWRRDGVGRYKNSGYCHDMSDYCIQAGLHESALDPSCIILWFLGLFVEVEDVPFFQDHFPHSLCTSYSFKL